MRGIAEFVMRSRSHAIAVSVIVATVPLLGWISTIIVALVCLRHGWASSSMLVALTVLPMSFWAYVIGDPSGLLTLFSTVGLALILRKTLSWEMVLIAALFFAALSIGAMTLFAPMVFELAVQTYVQGFETIDPSNAIGEEQIRAALSGFFPLSHALMMIVLLIVARWGQSALYNPGGFQKEFHQLRLSPGFATTIVMMMVLCLVFNEVLGRWLLLLAVPLLLAALGFVHWFMAEKKISNGGLTFFYIALLVFFQLVYPFMASLALMDSWFNMRNRIQTSQKD